MMRCDARELRPLSLAAGPAGGKGVPAAGSREGGVAEETELISLSLLDVVLMKKEKRFSLFCSNTHLARAVSPLRLLLAVRVAVAVRVAAALAV